MLCFIRLHLKMHLGLSLFCLPLVLEEGMDSINRGVRQVTEH